MNSNRFSPFLSVVIPAHNEAGNLPSLIDNLGRAFPDFRDIEVIVVDDASSDDSVVRLQELQTRIPALRVLLHQRQIGQSGALLNGVRAARGQWIGTLDGDGQNDPADLARLLQHVEVVGDPQLKLVQGWRQQRQDSALKRLSSRVANAVRSTLLRDATPDSGCGIRVAERDALLSLPAFDHMHRFLPALMTQAGWRVVSLPVNHCPRGSGSSHYGLFKRLGAGVIDILGVAWLGWRTRSTPLVEAQADINASEKSSNG